MALEADGCHLPERGSDRGLPGKLNLPGGQWRRAQQLRNGAGHRFTNLSHEEPGDPIIQAVRLILASASPRRAELLTAAGFTFETLAVDVDERVRLAERPDVYVRRLAAEKSARALEIVERGAAPRYILGADTSVVIDGDILGKPSSDDEARSMLRRLSGRRHEVLTGVSIRRFHPDEPAGPAPHRWRWNEVSCVETTAVFFAPLGDADIDWYVQSGEGLDKAGGYAIQGLASRFVQRIEGSYSNVVGLPVSAVDQLIRQMAEPRI